MITESDLVRAGTAAYDKGWSDCLTNLTYMLQAGNLTKDDVLEIVEKLRACVPKENR